MEDLNIINFIPQNLNKLTTRNILNFFGGPTLIALDFKKDSWVLVSLLLHGNEVAGVRVLKYLNTLLKEKAPQKNLAILVGNVLACREGKRHLEGQQDFNRIWVKGSKHPVVDGLHRWLKGKNFFATIDIHNNSGKNPLYACITKLTRESLYLASLFSRLIVYFETPKEVFSRFLSKVAPSVTLECGKTDNKEGADRALIFIRDVLQIENLNISQMAHQNILLYETQARILIDKNIDIGFGRQKAGLVFSEDIDSLNFSMLNRGHILAHSMLPKNPLKLINKKGQDITREFLDFQENHVVVKRPLIPSMFTKDVQIIKSDCFGYVMQKRQPAVDESKLLAS